MADGTTPVSPDLAQFFSSMGLDPGSLMAPPPGAQSQADLASAVISAAQAASSPYTSPLPWWAQGIQTQLVSQDQYSGVYNAGEGLVFLGRGATTAEVGVPHLDERGAPVNKFASEMAGPTETAVTGRQDYALTVTQAQNLPYTWSEDEVADAIKRLKDAGLQVDSFDMGSNSLVNVWSSLVNRAAQTYALTDGKRKLTPWDVLDLYKKEADASGIGPFTGSKTTVQKNVTDITEGEAFSSLQSNLSQMLGRDPSDQETRDFLYRMNKLAAENPTISRTVTRYKNGEAVSSSTHTDPGFTSADMAQQAYDDAQSDPDYAEYRGASYLFNAAMSALGPIGGQ